MKRFKKSIFFAALILALSSVVFANSGPTFWQGYPSSDIMSIKADSPITVKSEKLVFDFSSSNSSDYTLSGKVTAAYDMVNPTKEPQSVQMAFPYVGTLFSLSQQDVAISADDDKIPYDIYLGDVVDLYGNPRYEKETSFDFANIVSTITTEPYKPETFQENDKGKLYTIDVKPKDNQIISIMFSFNGKKTKVLANEFSGGYGRINEIVRVTASFHKPITIEILVLGEDIGLITNAYTAGEPKKETDSSNCNITTQEVEFKPYFMGYVKKHTNPEVRSMVSNTQLYNVYTKAIDRCFKLNMGYCSDYDLFAQGQFNRIMTLVYTVQFPKNSEKRVSISYKTIGTKDNTKTAKPLYSFDYILNPAENWKDFKNLDIEIIPPKEAPYIVKSSVDLIRGENKVYTAALSTLPEEDLSFTLSADKKITLLDESTRNLRKNFGYLAPRVNGTLTLLLIGIIIIVIIIKLRRNK